MAPEPVRPEKPAPVLAPDGLEEQGKGSGCGHFGGSGATVGCTGIPSGLQEVMPIPIC